jgi:hypothetical protein
LGPRWFVLGHPGVVRLAGKAARGSVFEPAFADHFREGDADQKLRRPTRNGAEAK